MKKHSEITQALMNQTIANGNLKHFREQDQQIQNIMSLIVLTCAIGAGAFTALSAMGPTLQIGNGTVEILGFFGTGFFGAFVIGVLVFFLFSFMKWIRLHPLGEQNLMSFKSAVETVLWYDGYRDDAKTYIKSIGPLGPTLTDLWFINRLNRKIIKLNRADAVKKAELKTFSDLEKESRWKDASKSLLEESHQ